LGNAALTRGRQTFRATVMGCWPDYAYINKHELASGRMLSQIDLDEARHVVVVGRTIVDRLWPERRNYNAVGESILINGRPFTIVGVFNFYEREEDKLRRERGETPRPSGGPSGRGGGGNRRDPFGDKNTSVQIPITTMFYDYKSANVVNGVDQGPNYKLDFMLFQVGDVNRFQESLEQTRSLLSATHRGIDDFTFITREDWLENIERNIRNTSISGGLIAIISLIVGGIGITNIMLASITERIREIGVRRAIGAKGRDIFLQIIVESSFIGIGGGVLGLGAAFGLLRLLAQLTDSANTPIVEPAAILISFSFAVIIGVLSGLFPAIKASRLDPIEALRYG
jgi:putative ABC transport system permease protein